MRSRLILFFLLTSWAVNAQNTQHTYGPLFIGKKSLKNYIGIKVGATANTFTSGNSPAFQVTDGGPLFSWLAGISADFMTSRHYNARAELSYVTKGAHETFGNENVTIKSKNHLQYIQLSALPLVLKAGYKKVTPYLALGGYYARRVGIKSTATIDNGPWESDRITATNLDQKNDYGYSIGIGVYMWQRPLFELRYEGGLSSLSAGSNIKNRTISLAVSI